MSPQYTIRRQFWRILDLWTPDCADQAARRSWYRPGPGDPAAAAAARQMRRVDAGNLRWLKQTMAAVGWPGTSLAGDDGAAAAWLLAQHADADPDFQRHCLRLVHDGQERGEATAAHVAYLTDRVLVAEGKPQEYGTQVTSGADGGVRPAVIRDPATVDQRRAAAGLEPLASYLAVIAETCCDQGLA